jgi:hypothetical protein
VSRSNSCGSQFLKKLLNGHNFVEAFPVSSFQFEREGEIVKKDIRRSAEKKEFISMRKYQLVVMNRFPVQLI